MEYPPKFDSIFIFWYLPPEIKWMIMSYYTHALRYSRPKYLFEIEILSLGTDLIGEGKFPVNKLVYFREMYKNSEQYRDYIAKFVPASLYENDPIYRSKTTLRPKLIYEATFAWSYIKQNVQEISEEIEEVYFSAKRVYPLYRSANFGDAVFAPELPFVDVSSNAFDWEINQRYARLFGQ
jgi:hypothetical protein